MTRTIGFIGPTGTVEGIAYKTLEEGVDLLVKLMDRETLDPDFHYNLTYINNGVYRYGGNFLGLSMVFGIETDDRRVISKLNRAIAANTKTPAYIAAVREHIVSQKAWVQWARGAGTCFAESANTIQEEIVLLAHEYRHFLSPAPGNSRETGIEQLQVEMNF